MDAWVAGAIFVISYAVIATERADRTLAALLGGLLMIALGVIGQSEAFAAVDLNVILLLAGLMIVVGAIGRTGLFDWLGIQCVRAAGGDPFRILLLLAITTGVLSAFLDNVTTVILIVPITLQVARAIDISPYPYLISQILASNIGGTATLIGDPPNILIGSAAGLTFDQFVINLGPVTVLVFMSFLVTMWFMFRRTLSAEGLAADRLRKMELHPEVMLADRGEVFKAIAVLAAVLVGFLTHPILGLEPATIAMLGATVMLLLTGFDPHAAFRDVEWVTLLFFVGLFMLVEGIVQVGIVGGVADSLAEAVGGRTDVAVIGLLWFSAVASAIVDNIPYTATMIPVVDRLIQDGLAAEPMWWSLALGACLGGNLTIIGASANVVVANVATRAGYPIRFVEFFKYGSVVVVESLLICTGYMWLRYLS